MLESEIGSAFQLEGIGWMKQSGADAATIYDVQVYVGLCASDQLSETFEENWVPWSKTLVFDEPSITFNCGAGEWFEIPFETPWWYGGSGNILIEVDFDGGDLSLFYNYNWTAGPSRSVRTDVPSDTTGALSNTVSYLTLTGLQSMQQATFADIKSSLGTRTSP